MGKGEIAQNEQFLLFPELYLSLGRSFDHFHQILNCRLQTLSVWQSVEFVVWERVKVAPVQDGYSQADNIDERSGLLGW